MRTKLIEITFYLYFKPNKLEKKIQKMLLRNLKFLIIPLFPRNAIMVKTHIKTHNNLK